MSERFHYSPSGDDNGRREGAFDSIFPEQDASEEITESPDETGRDESISQGGVVS